MAIKYKIFENLYQDSVSLMQLSAQINKQQGVVESSVVMGTEANLIRLAEASFGDIPAKPNDLVIAVKGEEAACDNAIAFASEQLTARKTQQNNSTASFSLPLNSLELAMQIHPDANLALISVPGQYAAAEALKAIHLGMNVMMFSDSVSLAEEKSIKVAAQSKGLMIMGPDCGTAIINGVPLGFANVVNTGHIGIVAASGTGLQEATCRVHQLGAGISQALGTGGHDLHQEIGGISMLTGLEALIEDENTQVIVLISKPPAAEIAEKILKAARASHKPVVVHFLGEPAVNIQENGLYFAENLAHSAELAVALLQGDAVKPFAKLSDGSIDRLKQAQKSLSPTQQYIRGVFAGGTFCYEAQLICQSAGIEAYSNTPVKGNHSLTDVWTSREHTIVDLGDDVFTQGRPHPMIDPTLRNQRLLNDVTDPTTAVILFDVVIGYGASESPVDELLQVINSVEEKRKGQSAPLPIFIAYVCGTERDPQNRESIKTQLKANNILVADCNAEAAHLAAWIIAAQNAH